MRMAQYKRDNGLTASVTATASYGNPTVNRILANGRIGFPTGKASGNGQMAELWTDNGKTENQMVMAQ